MSIIFSLKILAKHWRNINIIWKKNKDFPKKLNYIISRCIFVLILLCYPFSYSASSSSSGTRFICETPVRSSLSMQRGARLVHRVRVRMQICNFVAKHKRGPACRSSAWDVVRQKAVKRRGPRRSGPSYPRPLACKPAHACMCVHARAFAPVHCVYLRQAGTRSLRPRWSFPGIALSGTRRR